MSQSYWWQIPSPSDGNSSSTPIARSETHIVREVVHREVSFELDEEGDGRTLYTRIVPYNKPMEVADPPFFEKYLESWEPGVFDKQLKAANRVDVLLNFEHEKGIGGVVGRGVELRSQQDGLHGTFRLLNGGDGDKARELVHEKVLGGMSLEAIVIKSDRSRGDGITHRTEARLKNVALCRNPAFPGAEVLAVRTEDEQGDAEDVERAVWSTAFINDLPDSSFLYIEPGGDKDAEGKTTPRSLRHFPVKDADGNVDMPHLRNALSRIPQSDLPQSVKDTATAKAQRMMAAQGAPAGRTADPEEEEPVTETPQIVVPELTVRDDITGILEKVGVTRLERHNVVRAPWEASPARFQDDEYERSCLIDRGGDRPAKERCSLPVLEPTGELSVAALHIAIRNLPNVTGVTTAQRSEAARKLLRLCRYADLQAPQAIIDIAQR
jgi:HK97 family phage prohead protease